MYAYPVSSRCQLGQRCSLPGLGGASSFPAGRLAAALLVLTALVLTAYGENDPNPFITTFPHPNEQNIGDYAWSYGHVGERHWLDAELESRYRVTPGGQALKFNNPPDHRPYLISRPVDLGIKGGELRLKFQCIPTDAYARGRTFYVVIKRLQNRRAVNLERFDLTVGDTLSVDLAIPIGEGSSSLRIALEFGSGIRFGIVKDPSLRYADTPGGEYKALPIDGLTVSRQIYQASETVRLLAAAPEAEPHSCSWSIVDHQNQLVRSGTWTADAGTKIGKMPLGWYRLTSRLEMDNSSHQTSTVFVVVPDTGRTQTGFASTFGVQVEMNTAGLRKMNLLGAGWVRLHGADILKWKNIEPEQGRWIWPDTAVALFAGSGKAILGNLGQTPDWASSQPGAQHYPYRRDFFGPAAHIPRDISDWENYVRRVVSRYQGQITYWEVWNEPDIHFLVADERGKVNNYLSLLSTAHGVIKDIDSTLQVLAPAVAYLITDDKVTNRHWVPENEFIRYRNPDFYSGFAAAGSGESFDVFTFHHYSRQNRNLENPTILENGRLKRLAGEIAGQYGGEREIWVTEYNVLGSGGIGAAALDADLARQVCLEHFEFFARGISKVFTFTSRYHTLGFTPFYNFFDPPPDPTRVFVAYAVMTHKLDGYSYHSYIDDAEGRVRQYRFVDGRKDTIYIFAAINATTKFIVPAEGILTDYLGKARGVQKNDIWPLAKNEFYYFNAHPKMTR